ncbi:PREDICTED: probable serine/threonine-protein kinase yakA [Dufourea novaeangliae]|uniref:probable serine/threonine-protein kinase yakA n=1 Tax=Dufourea novaeangliae TaxID=178035 RepID=UPI000767A086|nr:PREDICTED: probable serine/threonine-protein kinase yakA [Dufourea novaeangliae]
MVKNTRDVSFCCVRIVEFRNTVNENEEELVYTRSRERQWTVRHALLNKFQATNLICWLLVACVCLVEARYTMRRPPLPPPQLMYKKSWPIAHRISMGNTMYINGNFPPKRIPPQKPLNYRVRRPPMYSMPANIWKNQMPIRVPLNNHAVLPQRPPMKEFHTVNKMPEYSPEYRPEAAVLPPTHRGSLDDDKGPIHTIPAPNLSPMDKPFSGETNAQDTVQRQQITDATYKINPHGSLLPHYDIAAISTSLAPQKPVTSPTPTHHYEVTETNDINQKDYQTVLPTFFPPDYATGLSTIVNPDLQTNDVYLSNQPASNIGLIGTNIQLGQPNLPMQTNLHSSLHVGFPGTVSQTPYIINQQIPDLHVGHPAPAGPPLSATQLYDLLNSFPQKMPEQYQTGQQPQLQQQILQQQLGQFFQPTGVTGFSQPQMQSFNYDEQDNKEQQQQQRQQQVVFNQDYVAGRVNTNYNVGSEDSLEDQDDANNLPENEDLSYIADGTEQLENNIEYDETNDRSVSQATYFNKVANDEGISTQFYTTLPNREAAEKLAALAAAGNVNSQLIGHLRKQQQQQQQQLQETVQNEEAIPSNHKHDDYETNQKINDNYDLKAQQDRMKNREKQRQQEQQQEERIEYDRQSHRQRQSSVYSNKRPLRIMVPDENEYSNGELQNDEAKEISEVEYEYENDDQDVTSSQSDGRTSEQSTSEFGSRLNTKTTV